MSARLQTIEQIFHAALDREPGQAGAFLDKACKGDELLRHEVDELLASHQRAENFIEVPVAGMAARIIELGQADLLVDQTIGHYKISQRIGTGGMGDVYLAADLIAGRKAALKILPMRFTGDPERLQRFQREARTVVGLNHPNILTVYEIGEDHSIHYIASELIEGETLRQHLTRGRMPLSEAIDIAIQVSAALAAAHDAGIVHRDIKPDNIMLRPDGYVKVLDFGIAKLAEQEVPATLPTEQALLLVETNLGSILGTVRYMSPEQARGAPADKRTDIWSLGIVLYEMITGHAPFSGNTPGEVLGSILGTEPPSLTSYVTQTPIELQQIVSDMLHKEREKRYRSAHELGEAFKGLRRALEFKAELKRAPAPPGGRRRTKSSVALALGLGAVALAIAFPFFWHRERSMSPPSEKSIAVLPFENFSDNPENSFFAAGIQDDILTSLAQIHDLKVISRTSVMAYQKKGGRNMREISRALGVANVLEGSVRRTDNRVLVNVQLIDARNDRHIWAQRYDRSVADSIGLQGELATQIAAALRANLAPEEKALLATRSTSNAEAYLLYLTALGTNDSRESEKIYLQAIALDPGFALAYAQASICASGFSGEDRQGKARARAEADEALRLSPTLGEAHMALGLCLYWGDNNYDAALKEFEVAAAISPNNADIYGYVGGIYRRQGRWREATASFARGQSLDPRNRNAAFLAGNNYLFMRDWTGAVAGYHRAIEVGANSGAIQVNLAYAEVARNGDLGASTEYLRNIPASIDRDLRLVLARWDLAMLRRDYDAAEKALLNFPSDQSLATDEAPKTFYQGRTAAARGDSESAQRYLAAATPRFEMQVRDNPTDAHTHSELAMLYAYRKMKEDAVREGRRAIELEPESQNAFHGTIHAASLALVCALIGEADEAVTLVERLLTIPGPIAGFGNASNMTLNELRLRWEWDSLRSDPRFRRILAGPEPKTVLSNVPR